MANGDAVTDAMTFEDDVTVYARFVEDPKYWIDISFTAGFHGKINQGQATKLHVEYDKRWGDILLKLPTFTPEVNYLPVGWFAGEHKQELTDALIQGQTYEIRFEKDPLIFGTGVQAPEAAGSLDMDGSGRVTVHNTTPGYQYIITDMNGNILGVQSGSASSNQLSFPDLMPGTRYRVYEAAANTTAKVGMNISNVTGNIGSPSEALVPVLENNYQVSYDETDESKTTMIISPADPDMDYAILDKNGNVVMTPGSSSDGWKTPVGSNPSKVVFPGLNPNEEYTVVTRPHGKPGILPSDRAGDGSTLVTDPNGDFALPSFIVETVNGEVASVDTETVNTSRQEGICKGQTVTLHAEPTNKSGDKFQYWKVLTGYVEGLPSKITTSDVTFEMPSANVVFAAQYGKATSTPSNAAVMDEVRGGSSSEMALDPTEIPDLERSLTTQLDRSLMDVNGADVTYKVVFNKDDASVSEKDAIKNSDEYDDQHANAFKAAWGLDVKIERYVNGRKVNPATPSDAAFNVYIQMDNESVDMMDYQLFEMDRTSGAVTPVLTDITADPEQTGGLFTFTAQAGNRYVMVYSRAYRVYFQSRLETPTYYYNFKVRKDDAPTDFYYSDQYSDLIVPAARVISAGGVRQDFIDWSYRDWEVGNKTTIKPFDPDKVITKKTYVYAFYEDNFNQVQDANSRVKSLIDAYLNMCNDNFLKKEEAKILEGIIAAAKELISRNPMPELDELLNGIQELEGTYASYETVLKERYDRYQNNTSGNGNGGGSGGGSGSGGGGGKGSASKPFSSEKSSSYVVGVNGSWKKVSENSEEWAFVLNGGMPLSGMWAWLEYTEGGSKKTGWYHFNSRGVMNSGWFRDEKNAWYYCDTQHEGEFGKMKTGWHYDKDDNNWYYLDPSGAMATGWRQIDGKWYFFANTSKANTYSYDSQTEKWIYNANGERPFGSMYANAVTPDGYHTGDNGVMQD